MGECIPQKLSVQPSFGSIYYSYASKVCRQPAGSKSDSAFCVLKERLSLRSRSCVSMAARNLQKNLNIELKNGP